ncbi:hypothetical protein HN51_036136 [Arachis hypogaea]
MVSSSSLQRKCYDINESRTLLNDVKDETVNGYLTIERKSSTYLFWSKAWGLVRDVYIQFHRIKSNEISVQDVRKTCKHCQSKRASSESSASSSSADMSLMTYERKYGKQWFTKNTNYLHPKDPGDELILNENQKDFEHFEHSNYGGNLIDTLDGSVIEVESLAAMNSKTHEGSSEPDNSCSSLQ